MAIYRIADARCARELACNNIGVGEKYSSHDACVRNIRSDVRDALDATDCARGVDAKELDECLGGIKVESCNASFEKIARVAACHTDELCRQP